MILPAQWRKITKGTRVVIWVMLWGGEGCHTKENWK